MDKSEENKIKSPWHIQSSNDNISLNEIMSEEKARGLQERKDRKMLPLNLREVFDQMKHDEDVDSINQCDNDFIFAQMTQKELDAENGNFNSKDCDNDYFLAKVLQTQDDYEHDQILKKRENKLNGTSKVSISLSNYYRLTNNEQFSSEEEEEEESMQHWDSFVPVEQALKSMPKRGYMKKAGHLVTKHDIALSDRRNAHRILNFPPEFQTGDGEKFDMKISNKVFNSLRIHSNQMQTRRQRTHDKRDYSTSDLTMDYPTYMSLFKLINKGTLEVITGIISTGKESIILHADGGVDNKGVALPKNCAIKIFKTILTDFKNRVEYIEGDFRFKGKNSKNNSKMLNLWAEKEKNNLLRMRKAGILCPDVVLLKSNFLIMSFIGNDNIPAPKLKHAVLDKAQINQAYKQICKTMKKLYNKANLVHADLSEYNILWHHDKCWLIDVGQAVEKTHPNADVFLKRDCININNFFQKQSINTMSDDMLYTYITNGLDFTEKQNENFIKDFEKNLENLTIQSPEKVYAFDYYWEKSKQI